MIHMLSAFNLKPNEDFQQFQMAYDLFIKDILDAGVAEASGPLARRVSDTPMDTDDERDHQYFSVMSFKDRRQLDAAYAHIEKRILPATDSHLNMYKRIASSVFICWEDLL